MGLSGAKFRTTRRVIAPLDGAVGVWQTESVHFAVIIIS